MIYGISVTKRKIILVVSVIVAVLIILNIWHYFHSGTIVITTNDSSVSNTVSLSKLDSNNTSGNTIYIAQGTGRLSVTVPLGSYVASVNGKVLSINKTIILSRHETLRYTLNAPETTALEPVVNASATSIAVNDSELQYLDTSINEISEVNSQNQLSMIGGKNLQSVGWADTSYGIAQDINNNLYIINNGTLTPLQVPEAYQNNKTVLYSITKSRQIYIAFGPRIYEGNVATGFKKIYTAKTAPDKIVASDTGVLLFTIPDEADNSAEAEETLINSDGKTYTMNVSINNAVWSPDNKEIALIGNGGNSLIVNDSLKQVNVLPNNDIGDMVWINDHTLIYGVQNTLWSYNLALKQSNVVADLQTGSTITQTVLDDSNKYLYVASQSDNGGEIDRIGLSGQQAPQIAYQIAAFFPDELSNGSCSVSYVNFTQPTLNVEAVSGLINCQSVVQSALQQDGIDASQLQINYGVEPEGD